MSFASNRDKQKYAHCDRAGAGYQRNVYGFPFLNPEFYGAQLDAGGLFRITETAVRQPKATRDNQDDSYDFCGIHLHLTPKGVKRLIVTATRMFIYL